MNFFPQRFRSKSISTPHVDDQNASQSCPNLLDLDDDLPGGASVDPADSISRFARTPGPELMSLNNASSPKDNKPKKYGKSLFLLPVKFRRAKERKAQTQALKLPVYPLGNSSYSQNTSSSSMMVPLQSDLEPPMNIRPKHTRPTGLGLGLGGFLGSNLKSPNSKLRRGSDSCILSPTSNDASQSHMLSTVIEHSTLEEDCDFGRWQSSPSLLKTIARRFSTNPPVSAPPICIVVSSSGDESGRNLLKLDPYKKYLGKSLEQVRYLIDQHYYDYECN